MWLEILRTHPIKPQSDKISKVVTETIITFGENMREALKSEPRLTGTDVLCIKVILHYYIDNLLDSIIRDMEKFAAKYAKYKAQEESKQEGSNTDAKS